MRVTTCKLSLARTQTITVLCNQEHGSLWPYKSPCLRGFHSLVEMIHSLLTEGAVTRTLDLVFYCRL